MTSLGKQDPSIHLGPSRGVASAWLAQPLLALTRVSSPSSVDVLCCDGLLSCDGLMLSPVSGGWGTAGCALLLQAQPFPSQAPSRCHRGLLDLSFKSLSPSPVSASATRISARVEDRAFRHWCLVRCVFGPR